MPYGSFFPNDLANIKEKPKRVLESMFNLFFSFLLFFFFSLFFNEIYLYVIRLVIVKYY